MIHPPLFPLFSFAAIHAEAPEFTEMSVEQEILETGIKVVDMLAPYAKGGKIGESDCQTSCTVSMLQMLNPHIFSRCH